MDDGCGLGGGGGEVHDHIKTFYYHITCIIVQYTKYPCYTLYN